MTSSAEESSPDTAAAYPTPQAATASRVYASAAGLLMLLASLAFFGILAPYGFDLGDEGHLVHQIYRTYLGQLPYRDFQTGYTPAVYYWNAGVFSLFGPNLIALRICLAAINALSVWCLYWLARRLGASLLAATVAGLAYLAFIPFHDGRFASFNIPYPAWYATLFWLLSLMCVVCWWERGRGIWWVLAGLCAGLVFAFKQNGGLLNLAALGITPCLLERPVATELGPRGWLRVLWRAEQALRWLIPLGGTLALMTMLDRSAGVREVEVFALPLLIVVLWQLLVPRARLARPVPALTLWRDLLLVGLGFAAVTLPWTVYFWQRLGAAAFLQSILYIGPGANYQKYYFVLYPNVQSLCMLFLAASAALVAVGLVMRRGWLPWRLVIAALALGLLGFAFWVVRNPPPLVEGLQKSVVALVQGLSFAFLLTIEWVAIAVHVVRTGGRRSSDPPTMAGAFRMPADRPDRDRLVQSGGTFLIVLVSAILMHLQLFPRSDFTHLVFAGPGVFALGAPLLSSLATLWGRGIARRATGRRLVRIAALLPAGVVIAIMLAPAVMRIVYLLRAAWEQDVSALVRLDSPQAPLVIEPAAGRPFMALSSTVHYVQARTKPDDFVFSFPCLDAFGFLLDRRDPTRHGYYFPGSPDHAVEAEVVDALRERQPAYIVTLHDHAMYFTDAPLYYFNLRHYVMQHYHAVQRLDMFDVLQRNDESGARPTASEGGESGDTTGTMAGRHDEQGHRFADTVALWRRELQHLDGATARRVDAALDSMAAPDVASLAEVTWTLDFRGQRLLASLIRKSRSTVGAAALATALETHALSLPMSYLFLQIIMEMGDQQSVEPLLQTLKGAEFYELGGLANDFLFIGLRAAVEGYWYVPPKPLDGDAIAGALPTAQVIGWIDNPWEMLGLRSFAVRMAGRGRDPSFTPFLVRLLGDANENAQLRIDAAQSLTDKGFGSEVLPMFEELLKQPNAFPGALVASVYRQAPERSRPFLVRAMQGKDDHERATAFWIAAGMPDPQLIDNLRAGLSDPLRDVRIAAVWGLGNLGGDEVLPDLQQVSRDGDEEIAAVAERALQRIVTGEQTPAPRTN